jgi:hypothetical protein
MEWNNRRLYDTTGMATREVHNLELCVEEFQSIFSFQVVGLGSRVENSNAEYTYGGYSESEGII